MSEPKARSSRKASLLKMVMLPSTRVASVPGCWPRLAALRHFAGSVAADHAAVGGSTGHAQQHAHAEADVSTAPDGRSQHGKLKHSVHAALCDLSSLLSIGTVQRRLSFEAMERQRPVFDKYSIALGIAAPNPLHRGLARLSNWISPIKAPMSVHARVYDAILWVRARMAEAGIHMVPPASPELEQR